LATYFGCKGEEIRTSEVWTPQENAVKLITRSANRNNLLFMIATFQGTVS
jgi:hypothetical protein